MINYYIENENKIIVFDTNKTKLQNTLNFMPQYQGLEIELKANNFYRGNPYINQVGTLLGLTSQQLDEFFETNDYTKLIS